VTKRELVELAHLQCEELGARRVQPEEGIRSTFAEKALAERVARERQPRPSCRVARYSVGSEEEQARNLLVEGQNVQATVTL
jgi:adenine-specific DNA-methyltransferase